jgi:serine/threonine protein kinase/Rieske Fe-S protein
MQAIDNHQLTGKDAGNYHIDRLLGKGPLSHFYEAHPISGQRVMLTVFSLPETTSEQDHTRFLARFKQEGEGLTMLKHPAIIPVYDYGVYDASPFLVTPFVPGRSLAQILRAQSRFAVESVLHILHQVADGLDYAHRSNIVHGTLSTANTVQNNEDTIQIAGFGCMPILAQQLFEQDSHANAALVNALFAGSPARMAPEIVAAATGHSVAFDVRVDIYALGILLYELLSGRLPFSGETLLEVAQQHAQQRIPSISALRPMLPASIDAVLQKALERRPEQRFQAAGELAFAFEQALQNQHQSINASAGLPQATPDAENAWSSLKNYNAEKDFSSGKQPVVSAYPKLTLPLSAVHVPQQEQGADFDPFVWWTNVAPTQTVKHPNVTKGAATTTTQNAQAGRPRQDRRKVVALLTAGSVVTVIGFGGGTIALARLLHKQSGQAQTASTQAQQPAPTAQVQQPVTSTKPTPTAAAKPKKPVPTAKPKNPTPAANATPTANAVPTTAPTPTPTPQPPVPTPTPKPQHTGTVIGSTSMGTNSAQTFSNPANGNGSVLIHLQNGNFVAYDRACTHAGVPVNYDSGSRKLVCPAHGAVFDPANNANPTQGPANSPLSAVTIHVNADGTITA